MEHGARLRGSSGLQAEADAEVEAAAFARRAVDVEFATHQAHQVPADGQPEAGAAVAATGRGIRL